MKAKKLKMLKTLIYGLEFCIINIQKPAAKNKNPKPNFTTVLGSIFFLAIQIHKTPSNPANMITNNAPDELFTPFGSNSTPNKLLCKLLAANKLKEPPLCS